MKDRQPGTKDAEALAHVWVVEDDGGLRRVLARALVSAGYEVTCCRSARSFLKAYDPSRPGCILLDLRLPGEDGLWIQESLLERDVSTPIVFMSGHGDVGTAVRALKSGAVDFLQKPFGEKALFEAARHAVERDLQERRCRRHARSVNVRLARLTARENDVLELLVADRCTKEIAAELGISPRTVEIHRQRVMQKMEIRSVAALVRLLQQPAHPGH